MTSPDAVCSLMRRTPAPLRKWGFVTRDVRLSARFSP